MAPESSLYMKLIFCNNPGFKLYIVLASRSLAEVLLIEAFMFDRWTFGNCLPVRCDLKFKFIFLYLAHLV